MISPLLHTVARAVLPLAMLLAAHLLFRGHHLPGGGFVAGLLAATAIILQYVAADRATVARAVPVRGTSLLVTGLALATATGAGALAAGRPFLTSAFAHVGVPILGELDVSTVLLFDVGVFLVVTGVTLSVLLAIEQ